MKRALPFIGNLSGEADAVTRMVLGLATMIFEEGSQHLSVSARAGREGLLVRAEIPAGFYAILGQLTNLGLGQLQRMGQ